MFSKSIDIIRENWSFYLGFIMILTVMLGIQDAGYFKSGGSVGTTVIWLLIARYIHRSALFGLKFAETNADRSTDMRFGGFILKGLLLGGVAIALAVPFMFLTLSPGSGVSGLTYLVLIVAFLIAYSVVLGLAGSWLPADVYGQNKGLGAAFKRGMSNFGSVFIRILGITLLGVAIPIALVIAFLGAGVSASVVTEGHINVTGAIFVVLMQTLQCFCITVTSVVLSHYYLTYEGVLPGQPPRREAEPSTDAFKPPGQGGHL
ncbi:hypothetical protein IHQ71_07175 [Rhizobium sp. TH2]|uniref:hypothetical protein n=1 Tax=Rhizobium sp. TH2 TaxID=2775403 RepID=UPI002158826E|nr:hypothetical protein [Rhizobium sp. TH2]UVC10379.1 hypothetical protein IHQ71_07175 [Rhizobium sp. TH2]